MQNKEINKFVLIPVPLDILLESGVDLSGVLQTSASDGKIIFENVTEFDDFVCDENCEDCLFLDTDCDGDCQNCPCKNLCEDCEVF